VYAWIRLAVVGVALCAGAPAEVRRVVVLKVDGMGAAAVDRWVQERDPQTGRSMLPWIDHVFYQGGARLTNFYVRGISLSVPSWSLLDTGHNIAIRGNAEFDRATGAIYDYLNFFPFYFSHARSTRADMPAVEVLDQAGIPLLIDWFRPDERLQGMQLFQRGVRWTTLRNTIPKRFSTRSLRALFNEWQTGFELTDSVMEQVEREIMEALAGDRVLYLDLFFGDYDHVMHLANDAASERHVMEKLDRLVGRIWSAIESSPLAAETVLAMVSDHGINADPAVYSQGYSLIGFFTSAAGGGHHVLTNRHPLGEYKIKGLDPFVSQVVTPSKESLYLSKDAQHYPTALLDLDGNERAAVYLRNSDINELHLLYQRALDRSVAQTVRSAAARELIQVIDRHRAVWQGEREELWEELAALRRAIARKRAATPEKLPKLNEEEKRADMGGVWRRERGELRRWERQEREYSVYLAWLDRILKLHEDDVLGGSLKTEALVPRRAVLQPNNIYRLQNYVVNRSGDGFQRMNYFELLSALRVRNNVQPGVSPQPIDFVAATIPVEAFRGTSVESERPDREVIFLYGSEERQALLLARGDQFRYLPVKGLRQDASGCVSFEEQQLAPGLPLGYFEDPDFLGDAATFLAGWHSEIDWFRATMRTRYSNGMIGLLEHFSPLRLGDSSPLWEAAGDDTTVLRRFAERLRRATQSDLLVLANDHWNFNVRGFNPGGNHGSLFRISTHSTLMFAGEKIPRGVEIHEPYDSLSFAPTLLQLMGRADAGTFPGRVIREITGDPR
jgi:hypothetical protein